MLKIGLTGGIGSGKSTVAKYFADLGVTVVDADAITRELVEPGKPAFREIVNKFGDAVLSKDGAINRAYLRALIFQDQDARKWLEELLHPSVITAMQQRVAKLTDTYCILVIPLLLECKLQTEVHRIIVVDIPVEQQIERTVDRDNITAEEVKAVLATQASRAQRLAEADDIIYNKGSLTKLALQVEKLHRRYLSWTRT